MDVGSGPSFLREKNFLFSMLMMLVMMLVMMMLWMWVQVPVS